MNKLFQNKAVTLTSFALFVLTIIAKSVFKFRVIIHDGYESMMVKVAYWDSPLRLLVTGEEFEYADHPVRIFNGDERIHMLFWSLISIGLLISLGVMAFKKRVSFFRFMAAAALWLVVFEFGLTLVHYLYYLTKGNFSTYLWQWDYRWIFQLLAIPTGFILLKSLGQSEDSDENGLGTPSKTPHSIRLFHGPLDGLLAMGGVGLLISWVHFEHSFDDLQMIYVNMILRAFLFFPLAFAISYLLFEKILGYTPFKLLTFTTISSHKSFSWGSGLKRSFSRAIPFEPFSVLGSKMWHDSIGKSSIIYYSDKSPLTLLGGFLKITTRLSIFTFLAMIVWFFISLEREIDLDERFFDYLYHLMFFVSLPMQISLAATLAEIISLSQGKEKPSNGVFMGLLCLIPLIGAIILGHTRDKLNKYLWTIRTDNNSLAINRFKAYFTRAANSIGLGLILVLLTMVLTRVFGGRDQIINIVRLIASLTGLILWYSGAFSLVNGIKKFWPQIVAPETDESQNDPEHGF